MTEAQVLVVDDEPHYRELLTERLQRKGWTALTAGDGREALAAVEGRPVDVALVDIMMPGMDGLELLRRLKEADPFIQAIVLTGHANIDTAIQAMKLGAFDYLSKPYKLSELDIVIERAMDKRRLETRCAGFAAEVEHVRRRSVGDGPIGVSPAWQGVMNLVRKAAVLDMPVLITGESGVGKELVATALHRLSQRASEPLVPVDCGALPEQLIESELFGHRRGAFTGAVGDKEGLFQTASSGTLFLDEIGELTMANQAKLLRVLETGEYRPLGHTALRRTRARVVAATNRDLSREATEGRFRQDLYYRLDVLSIRVPPLRERKEDIPLLVQHYLPRRPGGDPALVIDEGAMRLLVAYPWPGNVRELRNAIGRLAILADGPVIGTKLVYSVLMCDEPLGEAPSSGDGFACEAPMPLSQMERSYVGWVLSRCEGNVAAAARSLGISRSTLYRTLGRTEKLQ
jgi:DNA-binding NtrC family response regulator